MKHFSVFPSNQHYINEHCVILYYLWASGKKRDIIYSLQLQDLLETPFKERAEITASQEIQD